MLSVLVVVMFDAQIWDILQTLCHILRWFKVLSRMEPMNNNLWWEITCPLRPLLDTLLQKPYCIRHPQWKTTCWKEHLLFPMDELNTLMIQQVLYALHLSHTESWYLGVAQYSGTWELHKILCLGIDTRFWYLGAAQDSVLGSWHTILVLGATQDSGIYGWQLHKDLVQAWNCTRFWYLDVAQDSGTCTLHKILVPGVTQNSCTRGLSHRTLRTPVVISGVWATVLLQCYKQTCSPWWKLIS